MHAGWLVLALTLTACSSTSTATSTDAGGTDAGVDAALTSCALMGGICQHVLPENMSCDSLYGSYEQAYDIDCGNGQACCVTRDDAGQLPPALTGFVDCGVLLCPPGFGCSSGVDTVTCGPATDAAVPTTTACASINGICQPVLPENMTCDNLSGSYEQAYGIDCGTQRGCCVARDDAGNVPSALDGYTDCSGRLFCPPGFACTYLTDTVVCSASGDAGGD